MLLLEALSRIVSGDLSALGAIERRSFRARIDSCRWDDAARWLQDGDADLYALTDLEVEMLNRHLVRRDLILETEHDRAEATGPVHWYVRRLAI